MARSFRKSHTEIGKIYFYTASIRKWFPIFINDYAKEIVVSTLKYLSDNKKITVFAFVIMPTHIHLVFRQEDMNGKELPLGSFNKFTAHQLLLILPESIKQKHFSVISKRSRHQIWQRDPLAIEIYSRKIAIQKIKYIHFNPISKGWKLSNDDLDYYYSSARFYETGKDDFGLLINIFIEFDG